MTFEEQVAAILDEVVMGWANSPRAGDLKNVLIPQVLAPRVAAAIEAVVRCDGSCGEDEFCVRGLAALRGEGSGT